MKDKEIEVKLKLANPKQLFEWLEKNAKKVGEYEQIDYYFEHDLHPFRFKDCEDYIDADEWFRVRVGSNKNEVCYKCWYRDEETNKSTYCDEIETEIGDPKRMIEIIKRLGYKQSSTIRKHRESWKQGDFKFDCDDVDGLGFFVEVEFTGEAEDPMEGKQKIFSLLKQIGIEWKKTRRGYCWIQWNPGKEHFES